MSVRPTHYKVPPGTCPWCHEVLTRATAVDAVAGPRPGDLTVCFGCAATLRFDGRLFLRALSVDETSALPPDVVDTLNEVRSAIVRFRVAIGARP
jgi:hypothetical protein